MVWGGSLPGAEVVSPGFHDAVAYSIGGLDRTLDFMVSGTSLPGNPATHPTGLGRPGRLPAELLESWPPSDFHSSCTWFSEVGWLKRTGTDWHPPRRARSCRTRGSRRRPRWRRRAARRSGRARRRARQQMTASFTPMSRLTSDSNRSPSGAATAIANPSRTACPIDRNSCRVVVQRHEGDEHRRERAGDKPLPRLARRNRRRKLVPPDQPPHREGERVPRPHGEQHRERAQAPAFGQVRRASR